MQEEAVRAHVFHCIVQDIKARNADADPDELQSVVDTAVREVRSERQASGKGMKKGPGSRSRGPGPFQQPEIEPNS
jgi:hypothetical protein